MLALFSFLILAIILSIVQFLDTHKTLELLSCCGLPEVSQLFTFLFVFSALFKFMVWDMLVLPLKSCMSKLLCRMIQTSSIVRSHDAAVPSVLVKWQ